MKAILERVTRRARDGMIEADELIAQEARENGVLHMGCGEGALIVDELNDLAMYAIGVDDNAKRIRQAMLRGRGLERVEFICRPLEATGLSGSTFDFVFGYGLASRVGAIAEAHRLLRHGGVFVDVEINARSIDFEIVSKFFSTVETRRFGIVSRVTIFRAVKS